MSPITEFALVAALLGLTAGAINVATDEAEPEQDVMRIISTDSRGCKTVRTDAGWMPLLRRDGVQICEPPK